MKFSTRTFYGLKAIFVLAGRYGEGSLSVSHIAKKEGISTPYLEQILNALKKKGLVNSVRGPQGGYMLAKKPADIVLADLFRALEGKNFFAVSEKLTVSSSSDETAVANFIFWKKFEAGLQKQLSELTLKELMDEARRLKKTKSASLEQTFHI